MHHKKLIGLAAGLLLVVGGLSGCNSNKQGQGSNDNSSSSKVSKSSKADMQNSSSDQAASSTDQSQSSSQSAGSNTDSASSSQSTTGSRISTLNNQIAQKLGNVKLPSADGLSSGSANLNIRYAGNQNNYAFYYSVGNQALNLNDSAIQKETPYATFQKKTYATQSQAAAAVDYSQVSTNKGLPKVKLNSKITGYENAGGGQRYIAWNEGRWSITVHGSVVNNTDPKKTAVQAANLFEQYMLPAPQKYGAIEFNVHSSNDHTRDQTITWQDGLSVYTLKAADMNTAIQMAASVK
ncbi:hypothetical protein [Lentilactobacillus farraginis]|uniref:Lipoprotein n=1 Tax=Lentilactobacillus farraginis DSM 18382 = JCM 14108 TaxID=1423743 RepID=A0A0R1W0R8_9LACO|nr:hypothetical protein [Lentilactobacillus farraginis]KRM11464.1 lipoprotein precursor [Lentilactobacillus farraginis DSM 18382 = JCM 14108]